MTISKAAETLGAKGGRNGTGPAKSRSAQLRAYWAGPEGQRRRKKNKSRK